MTRLVRALAAASFTLVLAGASLTLAACHSSADHAGAATTTPLVKYHCPMHPTVVSDKPGDCPICGMKLVPFEAVASPAPAAALMPQPAPPRKILFYRSPMDPMVHSDRPEKDSMGMDFVPVYADEAAGAAGGAVSGRASVRLTPERRSLLGVRSEEVRQMRIEKSLRTVGRVTPDERRMAHVHTKFEGYVEHLYVDFTGMLVKKGDPLLAIYSPELVAAQQEYLLALRAQKQFAGSQIPSVAQGGASLLEAARERLRLWDVRAEDIAELERSGTVRRTLDLYAEVTGYVVTKNAVHGMRVMPTDTLFEIADLSHVWVLADVYDADLSAVHIGMPADITLSYLPDRIWRGSVTNVAPTVEEKTRTIKVRIEADNAGGALKPDMYADVVLRTDMGLGLVVSDGAIIDTGERKLVFLDHPDGTIEPREVAVGVRIAEGYQVLRGLAKGDRVVTAASFLLDSESSLKSALAAFTAGPGPAREPR
jgi:RND family efflux transporter MFP subunit